MAGAPKTVCPVTRKEFLAKAKPVEIKVGDGTPIVANARAFESTSVGFYVNEKITVLIDGVPVKCTCQINITAIGSKLLPAEPDVCPVKPEKAE